MSMGTNSTVAERGLILAVRGPTLDVRFGRL